MVNSAFPVLFPCAQLAGCGVPNIHAINVVICCGDGGGGPGGGKLQKDLARLQTQFCGCADTYRFPDCAVPGPTGRPPHRKSHVLCCAAALRCAKMYVSLSSICFAVMSLSILAFWAFICSPNRAKIGIIAFFRASGPQGSSLGVPCLKSCESAPRIPWGQRDTASLYSTT